MTAFIALTALLLGVAAGWWLRGGDRADDSDHTALSRSSAPIAPAHSPPPTTNSPIRSENRVQTFDATTDEHNREPGEAPSLQQPSVARALSDPSTDLLADELRTDEDPNRENQSAEQRAREREEDFEAYGDGPVARDPESEVAKRARAPRGPCLALGAQGCRQDLDCCDDFVCRTKPGQIAGFLECQEPR